MHIPSKQNVQNQKHSHGFQRVEAKCNGLRIKNGLDDCYMILAHAKLTMRKSWMHSSRIQNARILPSDITESEVETSQSINAISVSST